MRETRPLNESRMKEAITEFLTSFPFFDTLDTQELALAAEYLQLVEIDEGKTLFKEGERGDCVYFVVSGELDVIKETVGGRKVGIDRVVISTLTRGRSIGEMSVIDGTPRSATVKARTHSTLAALTLEGFNFICEQHPKIGVKILKGVSRLLSMNMRKTSSRLADYMLPMG
ncbi:MAG: cyclic nucleotide-binding domain-containing protein [Deltaproteobacteria bacterium]|nr:cyclic nucleotide-binding domain-containing protein [Deltaproteobacteria bacterium]